MNNMSQISDMIHEYDASTLKFLLDISLQVHTDPTGSSLLFHFAGNPYFTNTVLTKYYKLKTAPDNDDPFGFCANVPCAKRAKLPNLPNEPKCQTYVPNESLFNFFDAALKVKFDFYPKAELVVHADSETGEIISDQIVPRAVLFFTSECVEDDDFDGFGEDEDSEDSDGDSDGDDDEDE